MTYWRHRKGGIYYHVCEAHHTETDEHLVIYQSIPGHVVHARPYEMFHDGRFVQITEEEAHAL